MGLPWRNDGRARLHPTLVDRARLFRRAMVAGRAIALAAALALAACSANPMPETVSATTPPTSAKPQADAKSQPNAELQGRIDGADGPVSVASIANQVIQEGVKRVVLLSDDPERHRRSKALPLQVTIGDRDSLDEVQRELRETPGCTVLIYDQTCAAEKRRRRKRGTYADPPKRLFISKEVCEGCGDCSVQSTCVSLIAVDTALGRKRAIDQSNCNKDYSCVNGFCPSFLTIHDAGLRKAQSMAKDDELFAALPEPQLKSLDRHGFNLMVSGIGGTGVITVGALLGMAAHLQGLALSSFDMTGTQSEERRGLQPCPHRAAQRRLDLAAAESG